MSKNYTIYIVILILIVGGFIYYQASKKAPIITSNPPVVAVESIKGCYVAFLAKDIYRLTILSQTGDLFAGTLSFKNFEKDSSSGHYNGTYDNGIILGKYIFQSEGTTSNMQVIFKKQGSDFIRGYGEMNATGDSFKDLNAITYDSSLVFKATTENCEVIS